jgi:hypothetical protein
MMKSGVGSEGRLESLPHCRRRFTNGNGKSVRDWKQRSYIIDKEF